MVKILNPLYRNTLVQGNGAQETVLIRILKALCGKKYKKTNVTNEFFIPLISVDHSQFKILYR